MRLILGGGMDDHMTELEVGEGMERTFQGLAVGLAFGVILWGILFLLWMII